MAFLSPFWGLFHKNQYRTPKQITAQLRRLQTDNRDVRKTQNTISMKKNTEHPNQVMQNQNQKVNR